MKVQYRCVLSPAEEGGFTVAFPDLPDVFTEGDTEDEALFNASEVLSVMLEEYLSSGTEVPVATDGDGVWVSPDASTQIAVLVRSARGSRSLSEVARALETSWGAAQRFEDPSHTNNLKQIERVASALGKTLVMEFRD